MSEIPVSATERTGRGNDRPDQGDDGFDALVVVAGGARHGEAFFVEDLFTKHVNED